MTTKELYESQQPLTTIRLYGVLGAKFGRTHRLAVASVAEAVRALSVLYAGFEAFLMNSRDNGLGYAVFYGKENIREDMLLLETHKDIRIAPIILGSKSGGLFSVILGVALIGVSFFIPGAGMFAAGLFNAGIAMALGGVVQLLSPQPKDPKSKDKPENEPNYAFNGPVNTQAQGNCVPVAYGQPWTGSAVVSAGIQVGTDIYIPQVDITPTDGILGMSPAYYYASGSNNGTMDVIEDISGNGSPPLELLGDYDMSDGQGVVYDNTGGGGGAKGDFSNLGLNSRAVACYSGFRVDDIAGGTVNKHIFSQTVNTTLGFNNFAMYLRDGLNNMTPTIQIDNPAGTLGCTLLAPTPVGVGSAHSLGFEWHLDGMVYLVLDGAIIDSVNYGAPPPVQAFPSLAYTITAGAEFHTSAGFNGRTGPHVGFTRALDDDERSHLHELLLQRFEYPLTPAGSGDDYNNSPEETPE